MHFALHIVIFTIALYVGYCGNAAPVAKQNNITALREFWTKLRHNSTDPHRKEKVVSVAEKVVGVYDNPLSAKESTNHEKLRKTIVTLVVENYEAHDKYRALLLNLLCYFRHYHYKTMVYLINRNQTQFEINKAELEGFYHGVHVVDYPVTLFWDTILTKTTEVFRGSGKADYAGDYPSFAHYGAIPMLVPALELLTLGYNVVYFDVDLVLIEDPLLHMLRGDGDVVLQPEIRSCYFPSVLFESRWHLLEPNTGTMFLQSNNHTVQFFRDFLSRVAQSNWMNDQRSMQFQFIDSARWTKSCDSSYDHYPLTMRRQSVDMNATHLKYCYLSEFQFHNGFMELSCSKQYKSPIPVPMYDIALVSHALPYASLDLRADLTKQVFQHILSNHSGGLPLHSTKLASLLNTTFPHLATVHFNYCGDKHRCLHDRNLWIFHKTPGATHHKHQRLLTMEHESDPATAACRAFDITHTSYAKIDWASKLQKALDYYTNSLRPVVEQRPKVVRFEHEQSPTHLFAVDYDQGKLRHIVSLEALHSRALSAEKVVGLKDYAHWLIPYGDPITPLQHTNKHTLNTHR